MARDQIEKELDTIRKRHRGVLRPVDVVHFARGKKTALHGQFAWDDTEAAEQYRLWQARQVIRVHVTMIEPAVSPVRAYVSLQEDRVRPGGGYRMVADVLKDPVRRAALLAEALRDLKVFEGKYRVLTELAPVFEAIKKLRKPGEKAA